MVLKAEAEVGFFKRNDFSCLKIVPSFLTLTFNSYFPKEEKKGSTIIKYEKQLCKPWEI